MTAKLTTLPHEVLFDILARVPIHTLGPMQDIDGPQGHIACVVQKVLIKIREMQQWPSPADSFQSLLFVHKSQPTLQSILALTLAKTFELPEHHTISTSGYFVVFNPESWSVTFKDIKYQQPLSSSLSLPDKNLEELNISDINLTVCGGCVAAHTRRHIAYFVYNNYHYQKAAFHKFNQDNVADVICSLTPNIYCYALQFVGFFEITLELPEGNHNFQTHSLDSHQLSEDGSTLVLAHSPSKWHVYPVAPQGISAPIVFENYQCIVTNSNGSILACQTERKIDCFHRQEQKYCLDSSIDFQYATYLQDLGDRRFITSSLLCLAGRAHLGKANIIFIDMNSKDTTTIQIDSEDPNRPNFFEMIVPLGGTQLCLFDSEYDEHLILST